MTHKKTPSRLAIEAVMNAANPEQYLTAEQISERSGVNITMTRHHIGRMVNRGFIYNVGSRSTSAYCKTRPAPAKAPEPNMAQPRQRLNMDSYTGERAIAIRPGADLAFTLPSLVNSVSVPRVRPTLIGGGVLQAVGMGRQ